MIGLDKFNIFTKDKVTYLFRKPKPEDVVMFVREKDINKKPFSICLSFIDEGTPIYTWVIGKCPEYVGKIKEKREDSFLVLPEGKISQKHPYGWVKGAQIKGRVCNFFREEMLE